MSQNLVSMVITKEQQLTVLALIAQILQILDGLISLDVDDRRSLINKGPGSDRFVRIILLALQQNPGVVPRNMDLTEAHADMDALDMLEPIVAALLQLTARVEDTKTALGSDLMVMANKGYALLQANGNVDGLEEVLNEASYRYKRRRKSKSEPGQEK